MALKTNKAQEIKEDNINKYHFHQERRQVQKYFEEHSKCNQVLEGGG